MSTPVVAEEQRDTIEQVCAELGITADAYTIAKPAPFGGRHDGWHVTLKRGTLTLETDFWQGTAHREFKRFVNAWALPKSSEGWRKVTEARDLPHHVKRPTVHDMEVTWFRPIPPKASDVLGCLVADAGHVDNGESFEDFCSMLDLDTDSRKAEQSYNACQRIALQLRGFLGEHYDRAKNAEY